MIHGVARFLDAHTLAIDTADQSGVRQISGDVIIIAIGSAPVQPALFPFAHSRVWDSDEILELKHMPRTLAVVGAGVIGSEYACTFATLEAKVHMIDGRDTLLPFMDHEISDTLQQAMIDLGIQFHWKENVVACEPHDHHVRLALDSGRELIVDAVLVAAGRTSHTDRLNPEAAGLHLGKRGLISVNEYFQTNVSHIYAVGDVVGFPALASTSAEQGRVAASHACG